MALFDDMEQKPGPRHNGILTHHPTAMQTLRSDEERPNRPGPKLNKSTLMKHSAYAILREAGAGPTQAAKALGYVPSTGTRLEKKLNAYELKRDKLLSSATQTVEKFIKGRPIGQVVDPSTGQLDPKSGVHPKGSDVMRAVELVMDREQPKIALSASVTAEFLPIDLSAYE